MPKVSDDRKAYHISRIRTLLVLDPNVSMYAIQEQLEGSEAAPLHLSRPYITKLYKKIMGERTHRNLVLNRGKRLSEIQDKKNQIDRQLWREASNMKNPGIVRVAALEKLMKNELDLLEQEIAAGAFDPDHNNRALTRPVMNDDHLQLVMAAVEAWGIIPSLIPKLRYVEQGPIAEQHTPQAIPAAPPPLTPHPATSKPQNTVPKVFDFENQGFPGHGDK